MEGADRAGLVKRGQARQKIGRAAMNQLLANCVWGLATVAAAADADHPEAVSFLCDLEEQVPTLARVVSELCGLQLEEVAQQ